mgnify:FL=1
MPIEEIEFKSIKRKPTSDPEMLYVPWRSLRISLIDFLTSTAKHRHLSLELLSISMNTLSNFWPSISTFHYSHVITPSTKKIFVIENAFGNNIATFGNDAATP